MEEQIKTDINNYLTCSSEERKQYLDSLLVYSPADLVKVIELPTDSENRFKIYEILYAIKPYGAELLSNIFAECKNSQDILGQLAAIEFIKDHGMHSVDLFSILFFDNLNNPILLPTIAEAIIPMIQFDMTHSSIIEQIVEISLKDNRDLLGLIPDIARSEKTAPIIFKSKAFMDWLRTIPLSPEERTVNIYIRTLLIPFAQQPLDLFLGIKNLMNSMTNPAIGLRVSCLEHIAASTSFSLDLMLSDPLFIQKVCDSSSDTTIDEQKSREKAINRLGILSYHQKKNGASQKEAVPELMVI